MIEVLPTCPGTESFSLAQRERERVWRLTPSFASEPCNKQLGEGERGGCEYRERNRDPSKRNKENELTRGALG